MILNEAYSFSDVRFLIARHIPNDYDREVSFIGYPEKLKLSTQTVLMRLDSSIVFGVFSGSWWMREKVFLSLLEQSGSDPAALRREWQNQTGMPKPKAGLRTQVIAIELTAPVYAWVGIASPLFHRPGGAEQVYLPNLARGTGVYRSDNARLLRTYTLAVG